MPDDLWRLSAAALGALTFGTSMEVALARFRADTAKWKPVIQQAGIKLD